MSKQQERKADLLERFDRAVAEARKQLAEGYDVKLLATASIDRLVLETERSHRF